jgi:hypothetical protein
LCQSILNNMISRDYHLDMTMSQLCVFI